MFNDAGVVSVRIAATAAGARGLTRYSETRLMLPTHHAEPDVDCRTSELFSEQGLLGNLLKGVLGSILTEIDHRLAYHGMTHAQWVPLFHMAQGKCRTASELARSLQSDVGAMSRTLDRLEAKGLLVRVRSSDDRRIVNLELSGYGREMAAIVPPVLAEVLNRHLAGFSWNEWRELLSLLKRMRTSGDALGSQPVPTQRPEQS